MAAKQLNNKEFERAKFIGVYREPNRQNQRIPIREFEGKHYNLLGNLVDLAKLIKVQS